MSTATCGEASSQIPRISLLRAKGTISTVMAGLDPAIHAAATKKDVDARIKSGHDE
jgi:hypothetical protein